MVKKLIDSIINDLANNKPISSILLKAQVIASKLGNDDFAAWIKNEQCGYPNAENLPEYRIVPASVKADVSIPFCGLYQGISIPVDAIGNDVVVDCMSHVRVVQSLVELEMLCDNSGKGSMIIQLPSFAYSQIAGVVTGNVERAYQESSSSSIRNVVNVFKSKLLEFFLQLNQELDMGLDFSTIESAQKISQMMNNTYNINAAIANIGDGTVNAPNVTNIIGDNNMVSASSVSELKNILREIKSLLDTQNHECEEICDELDAELSKPTSAKKMLKRGFQAIKGILLNASSELLVGKLSPLLDQALNLLQ